VAGAVPGSGHAAVAEVAVGADRARLGTALRVPETVWHVHVAMFSERGEGEQRTPADVPALLKEFAARKHTAG